MQRLLAMSHVHLGWLDDEGFAKRLLVAAGVGVSQDLRSMPNRATSRRKTSRSPSSPATAMTRKHTT
jgi:hypothetical protein